MKFIIVGKHASGKHRILDVCESQGIKVGHEFSNLPVASDKIYIDPKYQVYNNDDIENIFETDAYLCMAGIEEDGITDAYMYYRGISHYTFDNSDVIAVTLTQFENLNTKAINEPVVFVWLDNVRDNRIRRHAEDNRSYNFKEQEDIEDRHSIDFVKTLYGFPNSNVLYFSNEEPERVATIISSIVKHPDLIEYFIKNYN